MLPVPLPGRWIEWQNENSPGKGFKFSRSGDDFGDTFTFSQSAVVSDFDANENPIFKIELAWHGVPGAAVNPQVDMNHLGDRGFLVVVFNGAVDVSFAKGIGGVRSATKLFYPVEIIAFEHQLGPAAHGRERPRRHAYREEQDGLQDFHSTDPFSFVGLQGPHQSPNDTVFDAKDECELNGHLLLRFAQPVAL